MYKNANNEDMTPVCNEVACYILALAQSMQKMQCKCNDQNMYELISN